MRREFGEGGSGAEVAAMPVSDSATAQQEAAKPGRNHAHAVHSSGQDNAEKIKREEIARRAKEAMAQLLEGPCGVFPVSLFVVPTLRAGLNYARPHAGPDLETLPTVSWNRLGLSVASSLELRKLR